MGRPEFGFVEISSFWQNAHARQHEEKKMVPLGTRGGSSPVWRNADETLEDAVNLHQPFSPEALSDSHLLSQKWQLLIIRWASSFFKSRKERSRCSLSLLASPESTLFR